MNPEAKSHDALLIDKLTEAVKAEKASPEVSEPEAKTEGDDAEPLETEGEDEAEAALESYDGAKHQSSIQGGEHQLALEDSSEFLGMAANYAGIAAGGVAKVVKLGFKQGLKTGVFLLKNLALLGKQLFEQIDRRVSRYGEYEKRLRALKEQLTQLKDKDTALTGSFKGNAIYLQIDGKADASQAVRAVTEAVRVITEDVVIQMQQRQQAIETLITDGIAGKVKNPEALLRKSVSLKAFKKGVPDAFKQDYPQVDNLLYQNKLPGNALIMLFLPSDNLANEADVDTAFANAGMLITKGEQDAAQTVDYVSLPAILGLIEEGIALCQTGLASDRHIRLQAKQRDSLANKIKRALATIGDTTDAARVNRVMSYSNKQARLVDILAYRGISGLHRLSFDVLGTLENFLEGNIRELLKQKSD